MPVDLRTELVEIRRELLAMGALVEERVGLVFTAMEKGDVEAAARIRDGDTDVDRLEVRMEEHCMRLLALAQPVAGDLRFILTVLRVNGELERIADLAKGIAKRVIRLGKQWHVSVPETVVEMGRESRAMLSEVLTAVWRRMRPSAADSPRGRIASTRCRSRSSAGFARRSPAAPSTRPR